MRTNLDDNVGGWQVNGGITDLTHEDSVELIRLLEVVQDVHPLRMIRGSVNEWPFEGLSEVLLGKDVVRVDNDLVTACLMQIHQVLTGDELVWVADVEAFRLVPRLTQVLLVKDWRHLAPDLDTLHVCKVTLSSQIQPVRLVKFWPDQVVELRNFLILSHQGCCQTQLASRLDVGSHNPELLCRHHLDLVHNEKSPVNLPDNVHFLLHYGAPITRETDHLVSTDEDASLLRWKHIAALLRAKSNDWRTLHVGPLKELLFPLPHADIGIAENKDALFDVRGCRDPG